MRRILFAAALALAAGTAAAGTPCEGREASPELARLSLQMADATRSALEKMDDEVVLIARVGQDLSKYGLTYSHMGFAVREHPAGAWSIVHKLNSCGTATSNLYDQGLVNFFFRLAIPVPGRHLAPRSGRPGAPEKGAARQEGQGLS